MLQLLFQVGLIQQQHSHQKYFLPLIIFVDVILVSIIIHWLKFWGRTHHFQYLSPYLPSQYTLYVATYDEGDSQHVVVLCLL
jgi:hypothetical protein